MIPLRDNVPTRRLPVMTLFLIGLNVYVFLFEGGGVAWFAHLGGFLAGPLLIGFFRRRAVSGRRQPGRRWGY
jgi:membrane associated rhomboid family serine protease